MLTFLILIFRKEPAHDGLYVEDFEIGRGDQTYSHLLRLGGISEAHVFPPRVVGDHLLETMTVLRKVSHVQHRRSAGRARPADGNAIFRGVDTNKLVRRRERQGPKHECINCAENSGISADA